MSRHLTVSLLVLLFVYAGFSKVFDLKTFVGNMYNQPLPRWLVAQTIIFIPVAEISTAAGLLFEKTQRPALYGALVILVGNSLYMACILLHLFAWVPCTCVAIFQRLSWGQHLLLNLLLISLTVLALTRKSGPVPLYP